MHTLVHCAGVDESGNSVIANITVDRELFTTQTERERNVGILLTDTQTTAQTYYYGLIDKSDTTNWPHGSTGRIDLSIIQLSMDKQSNGTGQISIGVITRVDGTDADIEYVDHLSFEQNDTISVSRNLNFAPTQLKCSVVGGTLNRIKSTVTESNVSSINTAGGDLSFNGETFTPAVGDIIARFIKTGAGSVSFTLNIFYHGEDSAT